MTALPSTTDAKALPELRVDLGPHVRSDSVDAALVQVFTTRPRGTPCRVNFDFSEATFIEPTALQMAIAWMLQLKRAGDLLSLRVPRDRKVRDFWRAWGFPQAVNDALGSDDFRSMTPAEDIRYFGEQQRTYLPASLPAHPGFGGDTIRSANFFGFHTARLNAEVASGRLAYDELDSWNVAHIRAVLSAKVGGGANYFASRVVFEAVLNALRHPAARILQTASINQDARSGASAFSTHFWDDGTSMGETLRKAIEAGVAVRGEYEEDFNRRYLVSYSEDDKPDKPQVSVVDSKCDLGPAIPRHMALFATILPAVTSDRQRPYSVANETTTADPRFGRRGMGLYVLLNAVVEVLDGSVAFRTGPYFMNVRKTTRAERAHGDAQLRVRIKRRSEVLPDFLGNLVTVRLRSNAT